MSTDLKLASPAPDVDAPSPTITAADRLRRANAAMSLRVEMLRRELGSKNGRNTAPDVPPDLRTPR